MPAEADIVWSLKNHLQQNGLGPQHWSVSDIAVDSDGAYRNSPYAADLEPMMSMPIHDFYPDLVCAYENPLEEGLAAFEAKARFEDWLKAVSQARAYREGVHRAFVALPDQQGSRYSALETQARQIGVGVWLLRDTGWVETVAPAPPSPGILECRTLTAALRGAILPRRLQLNHPLNYLVAAWARFSEPELPLMQTLTQSWSSLRVPGSRKHAINGARYLGLLTKENALTPMGLTICDLMRSLGFESTTQVSMRSRLLAENPGLAALTRLVLMQQESTKLITDALRRADNRELDTEQLLREAARINQPLASALFLVDPRSLEKTSIPGAEFSPSFVFQFKQSLFHAGILSISAHPSAGKGAHNYRPNADFWRLEARLLRGNLPVLA
jgi:hypothetical protein